MEYTWKITGVKTIDTTDSENVIAQTYWEKIGVDENGKEGRFSGATPLHSSMENKASLIKFEELTEDIIIGWIKSVVVGSYEEHVNLQIKKQIDLQSIKQPVLPWETPIEEIPQ